MGGGPPTGGRLADAFAAIAANARVQSRPVELRAEVAAQEQAVTARMETWERELAPLMAETFARLAAVESLPPDLKRLIEVAIEPAQQTNVVIQVLMFASFAYSIIFQMGEPLVRDVMNDLWRDKPSVPLDPGTAASLAARGLLADSVAQFEAANNGTNGTRFEWLKKGAAHPPSPPELLTLWRRGFIRTEDITRALIDAGMRGDWTGNFLRLAHDHPSPSTALNAVVANQMTEAQGRELWEQGGLEPEDFDWALGTAGQPPPIDELIRLWRRGDIAEADVRTALLEGPIKNKWIPAILKFKTQIPPMEQTIAMVRRGSMTPAEGIANMLQLGFQPRHAEAMIAYATEEKLAATKDLALTAIKDLYRAREVTREAAAGLIVGLGYDDGEAGFLLDLVDGERVRKFREAAIGKVRTLYVAHKVDATDAAIRLDQLGVVAEERADLLTLWDLERVEGGGRELTAAQLVAVWRRGVMTEDEAVERLQKLGYDRDDAFLVLAAGLPLSSFEGGG